MKRVILTVAMALIGLQAVAAPLGELKKWVEKPDRTNGVEGYLTAVGITNQEDCLAIVASGWDEGTVVDIALRTGAFELLAAMGASRTEKLQQASWEKISASILAKEKPLTEDGLRVIKLLPVSWRLPLTNAIEAAMVNLYTNRPAYGRLFVKYTVLQNAPIPGRDMSVDDLVEWLLAPEPMSMDAVEGCKRLLAERAVPLARQSLAAEGKSFVTRDGVNPLTAKVQPVLDALNAPLCAGLEEALRSLGTQVKDVDRTGLDALSKDWQDLLWTGVTEDKAAAFLGKVAVVLGPTAYNAFVDHYNGVK